MNQRSWIWNCQFENDIKFQFGKRGDKNTVKSIFNEADRICPASSETRGDPEKMIEMRFDRGCVWFGDNQTNYNKSNQWTIRISNDVIYLRDHVSWNSYFYANDRIIRIEKQEDETSMAIDISQKSGTVQFFSE